MRKKMNNYECPNCGNLMSEVEEKCRYCGTTNPKFSPTKRIINNVSTGSSSSNSSNSSAVYSSKSRIACGLLQIFFGGLGVGRFYSGHNGIAIAQLLLSIFTFGFVGSIWGLIDGIIILANPKFTDSNGNIMKA